mmetsp:Transcript_2579/g.8647  ORF Transcript_2579/g.8647 Transcript_2579/m.8647 type:complete len:248 (-) Transcript_2579:4-747(-)
MQEQRGRDAFPVACQSRVDLNKANIAQLLHAGNRPGRRKNVKEHQVVPPNSRGACTQEEDHPAANSKMKKVRPHTCLAERPRSTAPRGRHPSGPCVASRAAMRFCSNSKFACRLLGSCSFSPLLPAAHSSWTLTSRHTTASPRYSTCSLRFLNSSSLTICLASRRPMLVWVLWRPSRRFMLIIFGTFSNCMAFSCRPATFFCSLAMSLRCNRMIAAEVPTATAETAAAEAMIAIASRWICSWVRVSA